MDDRAMNNRSIEPDDGHAATRAPWEKPALTRLPRLTELTLQTGGGIGGGGSGGSTVFG